MLSNFPSQKPYRRHHLTNTTVFFSTKIVLQVYSEKIHNLIADNDEQLLSTKRELAISMQIFSISHNTD